MFLEIVTFFALLGWTFSAPREEIIGQIFYRQGLELIEVPTDIPANMTDIYLDNNSIRHLSRDVFSNLTHYTLLSLGHNAIRSMEVGAFNGLGNLDKLDLIANNMKILEQGMFDGMPQLRVLDVASNGVHTISEGCFRNLGYLRELYLTANNLSTVNGNMWLGLNSLTRLDLQYNLQRQGIPPGGLSNLPKLKLLHLHNNGLKTLTKDIFTINDYPESNGHPPILGLSIGSNPLVCDIKLCWLKKGEEEGWLNILNPNCANNVDWYNLKLNCIESESECKDLDQTVCQSLCEGQNLAVVPRIPDSKNCMICQCEKRTDDENKDNNDDSETLTLALVAVASVTGGMIITAAIFLLCLKRHGVKFCYREESVRKQEDNAMNVVRTSTESAIYDVADDPY